MPNSAMIEAHGSFAKQRCIECRTEFPDEEMHEAVRRMEVPHCKVPQCNGLVKPDIVFFGEQLPEGFFRNMRLPAQADLAIVMGTSLKVHPFAMLPQMVSEGTPRVLINQERVGDLGSHPDDILLLGDCDEGVRKLAEAVGWDEELEALWRSVNPDAEVKKKETVKKSKDEMLEEEIDGLTKEVDKSLKVSNEHHSWLNKHLERQMEVKENRLDHDKNKQQEESTITSEDSARSSKSRTSQHPEEAQGDKAGLRHIFPYIEGKSSL